ncbi:ADP-ribose-binding protein [Geoalkalibacter halelectricus]|uniref:ADP-ribose-binding protein n=1 Tax=Geoalkalibacter halelectricus TaxID=2847045 RepID=A0ABY5ZLF6_9BACT|nr:ADP-ribose-binding protein [Geoalkalibacter halelectricus]MDO3378986.1 ADP-ribose-binding protein [Geoalkalibacter halelectricus]UWZ78802.1 ADP-ribose-binding protein [Geoalkalibacter halelectricus]
MHEITGNIWDHLGQAIVVITTNCTVDRRGRAVMGRGCAGQALTYFPDLTERLGHLLQHQGAQVHDLGNGLVSFPVEETAWSLPDPRLIRQSARQLRELADQRGWSKIIVPRPGCGGGGLEWRHVKPLLKDYFDDRFHIINAHPEQ